MATAPTAPPPTRPSRPPPPTNNSKGAPTVASSSVTIRQPGTAVERMPWRMVINGMEGWGKTSVGAYTPKPLIIMADNETGYRTLLENNRVPDVPDTICKTWPDVMGTLDNIPAGTQTLVFDALGGIERLCLQHVCLRDFGGDWGEKGFAAYGRGNEVAMADWRLFLAKLDVVRLSHKVNILLLSHCKVKTFKNPSGADFDRYVADCHDKTWAITGKWADAVLFGTFFIGVQAESSKPGAKGKAVGGSQRVVYTAFQGHADGKNRYGMPETFDMPDDPSKGWETIENAMKGGE